MRYATKTPLSTAIHRPAPARSSTHAPKTTFPPSKDPAGTPHIPTERAVSRLLRASGAELAADRLGPAPHLHDLGPALADLADDQLSRDVLAVE